MKTLFSILLSISLLISAFSCKKEPVPEKYFPKVKTIIQNSCLSCHSAVTGTWAGRPTSFDTDEEITSAYTSIKATVADPATPGPLGNKRMPQNGTLTDDEIQTIVNWFEKGGKATD